MNKFLRNFGLAIAFISYQLSNAEDKNFKVGDRVTMKINMAQDLLVSHVFSWNDRQLGDTLPLIFNGQLYHIYGGRPLSIDGTDVICRMQGAPSASIDDGTEIELIVTLSEMKDTGVVLMAQSREIFAGGIYCSKGRHSFYEEHSRFHYPVGLVKLMHDPSDQPLSLADMNQAFGRYVHFSIRK